MSDSQLRDRKAAAVREAVLDRLLDRLEDEDLHEVAVEDLADGVGVSRRTLYRYFPTRDDLFAAAGERYVTKLGLPETIDGPDAIAQSFAEANRRIAERPALARSLVRSAAGRSVRMGPRRRRVDAIEAALEELTCRLPPRTARQAGAVISHLCGLTAWIAVQDESGLDGDDSRAALVWALDALIAQLREQTRAEKEESE
jgi:AcrR family transcriptional regulator